ncbi:MAG: RluA family pseudouridine synthase [Defluviitaleaceae bacterium]|nr:RluA family pseudouridine synthase [Defluviitaleaceae bacterium]
MLNFVISEEYVGIRIDVFISERIEKSRSFVQKIIDNGEVLVNEKVVKSNYKLRLDDALNITLPEPEILEIQPENIPLDIVFEDDDLIVINKPQGMVVHPAAGHFSGTLVNAIMYHCRQNLSGINGVLRPGIVHRIDKDTSGLIVVAKNDNSHNYLSEQFAIHSIKRTYNAIVFGNMKTEELTVDKPIARHPKDRKKMAITKDGKRAVTHIKVIENFGKYTLIEANLETGRTHQIRVHLSSIFHSVLGDMVYGPEKQPFKLTGQTLHAKTLGFVHPTTKEYMLFESKLPEYFKNTISKINK